MSGGGCPYPRVGGAPGAARGRAPSIIGRPADRVMTSIERPARSPRSHRDRHAADQPAHPEPGRPRRPGRGRLRAGLPGPPRRAPRPRLRGALRLDARLRAHRPPRRRRRRRHADLRRARRPGQPAGPPAAGPRRPPRRPDRAAVRPGRALLRGHAGRAEDQRRVRAAGRRLPGRPHRLHHRATPGRGWCCRCPTCKDKVEGLEDFAPGLLYVDRRPPAHRPAAPGPADRRRARRPGRGPGLPDLHLGHHRQAQGRGHRAHQHLQLRPGRRRVLRRAHAATGSTRA